MMNVLNKIWVGTGYTLVTLSILSLICKLIANS
jgi:hypothetical protein